MPLKLLSIVGINNNSVLVGKKIEGFRDKNKICFKLKVPRIQNSIKHKSKQNYYN